jgi:hypothetical protein
MPNQSSHGLVRIMLKVKANEQKTYAVVKEKGK